MEKMPKVETKARARMETRMEKMARLETKVRAPMQTKAREKARTESKARATKRMPAVANLLLRMIPDLP